jgi:hypothetical protein
MDLARSIAIIGVLARKPLAKRRRRFDLQHASLWEYLYPRVLMVCSFGQ